MITIKTHQLLSSISELLKMMVEAGAEIYRVEETAKRTLKTYNIEEVDIYATTSNIILSIEVDEKNIKTHTRRIGASSINIEKIHRLNALARHITETAPEPDEIRAELDKIKETPKYSAFLSILFYGLIAGAFYLFFGGRSTIDLSISTLIGLLTGILVFTFDKIQGNKFLTKFICSFSACFFAFLLQKLGIVSSTDYIIIGNIMTLIPGTGLTNSLRDLFTGDSITGVLRLIEAALLALAIACGYIVTTILFWGWLK